MIKITSILFILLGVLWNYSAVANGGDQRVVENKFLINLSRSPFTPRVGAETSFIASFVDISKDKLAEGELIVKIRVARFGGGGKRKFIFEKANAKAEGGVLEFQYAFTEAGLHEIFFDFAFASNPQKIYEAPDFLLDVQPTMTQKVSNKFLLLAVLGGILAGFVGGWLARGKDYFNRGILLI